MLRAAIPSLYQNSGFRDCCFRKSESGILGMYQPSSRIPGPPGVAPVAYAPPLLRPPPGGPRPYAIALPGGGFAYAAPAPSTPLAHAGPSYFPAGGPAGVAASPVGAPHFAPPMHPSPALHVAAPQYVAYPVLPASAGLVRSPAAGVYPVGPAMPASPYHPGVPIALPASPYHPGAPALVLGGSGVAYPASSFGAMVPAPGTARVQAPPAAATSRLPRTLSAASDTSGPRTTSRAAPPQGRADGAGGQSRIEKKERRLAHSRSDNVAGGAALDPISVAKRAGTSEWHLITADGGDDGPGDPPEKADPLGPKRFSKYYQ